MRLSRLAIFIFCVLFEIQALPALADSLKPSVIYGDDNRMDYFEIDDPEIRLLADSSVALIDQKNLVLSSVSATYSAKPYGKYKNLCSDQPYLDQPVLAFCSGALVAPNRVLTAGHCIDDQEDCLKARIAFDYRIEHSNQTLGSIPLSNLYACKRIIARKYYRTGLDFAIIELDRPVPDRAPMKLNPERNLRAGTEVSVLGHPTGLPLKFADHATVRQLKSGYFVLNSDTFGGNSGSPVLNSSTHQIEGILVRGEADFAFDDHRSCNVENRCAEDGCQGESATLAYAVRASLDWENPRPMLEEGDGVAFYPDGSGNAKVIVRIPAEFATRKFELQLDLYSREASGYEQLKTVAVQTLPTSERVAVPIEFTGADVSVLLLGGAMARITLRMDGKIVDTDQFSIFTAQRLP